MSKTRFAAATTYIAAILIAAAPALGRPSGHSRSTAGTTTRVLFRTAAPRILRDQSIVLRGLITAAGIRSMYRFEYRALGHRGNRHTSWSPVSPRRRRFIVSTRLRHLAAGTTYSYRLVIRYGTRVQYGRAVTIRTDCATKRTGRRGSPTITAPSPPRVVARFPPAPKPAPPAANPAPPTTAPLTTPTPSLFWGAQIGTQLTGGKPPWDMTAVSAFQRLVGKAPAILPFNIPFAICSGACTWYAFPTSQMTAIRQYGSIPMLNWSSMSSPLRATEPLFTLAAVARGDFDTYLKSFAAGAAAWGHPFFLRFNWEMNSNWFPWAEGGNGNKPGDFVAAWRHVHDIFAAAGATNVNWVWCPSVITTNATIDLHELYPGSAYVNWTCMDGYNWGGLTGGGGGWQTFSHVFAATYAQITTSVAPGKPMMIGETASSESGGSKAAWINGMFSSLGSAFPQIKALIWFETFDGSNDWPLETSSSSLAAFTAGIAAPRFVGNGYASLSGSTITPP